MQGHLYELPENSEFIVGRGTNFDIVIEEDMVSRKHAKIMTFHQDIVVQDLNSTNGIEFQNRQIPHKVIEEGDVFYLCSFEIRFSYRGGGHRPLSRPLL